MAEDQEKPLASYNRLHTNLIKSTNAYGIILSILLAASFLASLLIPTSSSAWQRLFISFNGFSLFFSACGLLLFFSSNLPPLLPMTDLENTPLPQAFADDVLLTAATLPKFLYIKLMLLLSVTCTVVAHAFGGFAVVRNSRFEQLPILITCVLGGFVYVQAVWVMIVDVLRYLKEIHRSNPQLWAATKRQTVFGSALTAYIEFVFKNKRTNASIER